MSKLTKSLFVEFTTSPHVAWWHLHDKEVYGNINKFLYGDMDGMAIGNAVEQQVCQLLKDKKLINAEKLQRKLPDWYLGYHQSTLDALADSPDIIYQAGLCFDNLFCKCDFLVKNAEGTYDLREVKAKNNVRKKSKEAPILDELQADISFQHYMLQKTLKERYSGKAYIVYLNKEYVRHGEIDQDALLIREEVTKELKTSEAVENIIASMAESLKLPREEFTVRYPYNNEEHLIFFGSESAKGSVRRIPQVRDKKKSFYENGKTLIDHFTEDERAMLFSVAGEETKASKYISLWQQGEKVVNKEGIQEKIAGLRFPLFFYDYETISRPVPLLEGTRPRQQVVVQYSVHRMDEDGTISHKEAIIASGAKDNTTIIEQLVQDLEGGTGGMYIVWFKGFENTRNEEMALAYPQFADTFAKVNENTFDLMEIFSEQLYFHRGFHGSSSIKKVLPVLTDITYEGMEVPHGAMAADLLKSIVIGEYELNLCNRHIQNLLAYCKQDTRAMVCIYQQVMKELE